MEENKIPVGISACLLGENVRHSGGHCRSKFCDGVLSHVFSYQTVCPEVAIGMGTPRPAIRLVGDFEDPRVVGSKDVSLDVTDELKSFSDRKAKELSHLSGFIFMKNSPTCGVFTSKVYQTSGHPHPKRRAGVFAEAVMKFNPNLPVEEEGRLNDAALRENFIQRVYAYHDWRTQVESSSRPSTLVSFHARYKYIVLAHSQESYKNLGRLVSDFKSTHLKDLQQIYLEEFMEALRKPAHRRAHSNVLQHLLGYLKKSLPSKVRQNIAEVIDSYRLGHVHLAVPITLLRLYLEDYGNAYVKNQAYLNPYPLQLGLRNEI